MEKRSNQRLANLKTRAETGFDYVVSQLNLVTPFGRDALKEAKPFFPGEEDLLREEQGKVEKMIAFAKDYARDKEKVVEILHCAKDVTGSIERSEGNTLTEVEIFEIKSLLLDQRGVRKLLLESGADIPDEFIPRDAEDLLDVLDPRGDRMNTFYIYDEFSEALKDAREKKHRADVEMRKIQKAARDRIKEEFGINLGPKFDVVLPKGSQDFARAESIPDIEKTTEDYVSATFALKGTEEIYALQREADGFAALIDEEEARVRKTLSARIAEDIDLLLDNCRRVGRLDYVMAKAELAIRYRMVRPEIAGAHEIRIDGGRHVQVEDVLAAKGKEYSPISMELVQGVTCITGANMGGKTISLKLAGLVPLLAQYGYFVPADAACVGLSNFIQILIGDSQSVERGLSSFGSEMEEFKEILDHAKERSLILIDEIASGTNPAEGLALTRSIVDYMVERPYISLITTHFETVTDDERVRNMQVMGLAGADFDKLDAELRNANRRERIDIIGKYMDYRLRLVGGRSEVPKDALNIARMLGIDEEIIEGARKYI